MLQLIKKIFGTKQDRDVKELVPIVKLINECYEEFNQLSDDEIKAKTGEFKERIKEVSADLEEEKLKLLNQLKEVALDPQESASVNLRLEEIENDLHKVIEAELWDILPEAYAVVKQTCKRLAEKQHRYEYSGQSAVWDMVPYDVQLMGAIVLHQGKISEMATGEGKTLVAVLPMYLNSLAGKGVHLVTVNDYLAKRDAEWMSPVYEFLGVKFGSIQTSMESEDRKNIYNCDITYGTNNEFGFDYLRDNMVIDADEMVQREHWYAIVDEVDSVLIDEARTPLIISGAVGVSTDQKFTEMNPRVKRVVEAQTRLINQMVAEAEKLLATGNKDDRDKAGMLLFRAYHGLPKHKRLMKAMQDPENMKLRQETELFFMRDQGTRMHEIDDELYYVVEEKNHQIDLTDKGRNMLSSAQEDPDMFIIPDIAAQLSAMENEKELTPETKQTKTDELYLLYSERSDRIHTVSQLLRAYSLYEIDVEYVVQDGQVKIVDEFTGRILEGRRYSEGLHQAIEAKENVKVEKDTQTMATITLQNYFRLYKKLAGMTGTAETEAGEFEKIYKLEVVVIPTNRKIVRSDYDDLIFKTRKEKYNAMTVEIEKELKNGRAVLVGTTSVEVSELLSKMLKRKGVPHSVLNAKQHQKEAEIVAFAGRKGAVTIATNMAGRGTDIKLDHEVKKNGGLAILGSERHDARRIDRQLRGRAGRQGDPGSSQFFISLEDNLMRLFGGERIAGVMQKLNIPEGEPIQHSMITKSVERAQKKVEENNFGIRKRLIDYDDVMNNQRNVIYQRRRHALRGERLKGEIFDYVEVLVNEWYDLYSPEKQLNELKNQVRKNLLCEPQISAQDLDQLPKDEIVQRIITSANEFYKRKEEMLGSEFIAQIEKIAVLNTIDDKWKEHLRNMDELKEGIYLRAYGQKDPLLEYKQEASAIFRELLIDINTEAVNYAFKYFPKIVERRTVTTSGAPKGGGDGMPRIRKSSVTATQNLQFSHSSTIPDYLLGGSSQQSQQPQEDEVKIRTYRRSAERVGRNDACPCGSGKKYKNCCGKTVEV